MSSFYDGPKTSEVKVWHVPQIPMDAFTVECETLDEAWKIVNVLAQYDLFQYDNNIKPDYSNASGVVYWNEAEGCYEEADDPEDDE